MFAVCFNGPPRSGKDTAAELLAQLLDSKTDLPVRQESLSFPLRTVAYGMVEFDGPRTGEAYELFKTTEFAAFAERSGRQLMIDVSESFLKPLYGTNIMSRLLVTRNQQIDGILLIRDTGFEDEFDHLVNVYGMENVYLVRMHREGCDFSKDSRSYVTRLDPHRAMDLQNDGSLDDLRTEVARIYGRLVNQMGWKL